MIAFSKFERYRGVPSLQQIVFVYQDSVRVESWVRQTGEWLEEPSILLTLDSSLPVPTIAASLLLGDIYAGVESRFSIR